MKTAADPRTPLLLVNDLCIHHKSRASTSPLVRDVNLVLQAGQTLGLVGESGSGKSLSALAVMGLLGDKLSASGSVRMRGQELLGMRDAQLQQLRGNRMAMVFQEPMSALNPVHTIGEQVAEPLRQHQGLDRKASLAQAAALLDRVGIARAHERLSAYPHQFSGGQRQRIVIAMALACGPDLLIADEPTTALDVIVQQQILDLLDELVQEQSMGMLLISHDLAVVSDYTDHVAVMSNGQIVEQGDTAAVFADPKHAYTQQLMQSRQRLMAFSQARPDADQPAESSPS